MNSRQQLAIFLSRLKVFTQADIRLEQYPTDSEVAATILWDAHMQGEIAGKRIADLGSGTGILGIGALVLGASHVDFVELDAKAITVLKGNLEAAAERIEGTAAIHHQDIAQYAGKADLVLQNPPFGTQEKHIDMAFLGKAKAIAPLIYSLHKTSTAAHIRSWAQQHGGRIITEYPFSFPLKQTMRQHTRRIQRIEVSCFKIVFPE